ncbi:uncharacterized protein LOC135468200 isoform X2 [Liolophura sinensis]|uniref:uncharacterized protein LOC135468200 isoform X2 n=1 Tax=Liolophura sinensis TaxID=3198878 RepID=UPI0031583E0B
MNRRWTKTHERRLRSEAWISLNRGDRQNILSDHPKSAFESERKSGHVNDSCINRDSWTCEKPGTCTGELIERENMLLEFDKMDSNHNQVTLEQPGVGDDIDRATVERLKELAGVTNELNHSSDEDISGDHVDNIKYNRKGADKSHAEPNPLDETDFVETCPTDEVVVEFGIARLITSSSFSPGHGIKRSVERVSRHGSVGRGKTSINLVSTCGDFNVEANDKDIPSSICNEAADENNSAIIEASNTCQYSPSNGNNETALNNEPAETCTVHTSGAIHGDYESCLIDGAVNNGSTCTSSNGSTGFDNTSDAGITGNYSTSNNGRLKASSFGATCDDNLSGNDIVCESPMSGTGVNDSFSSIGSTCTDNESTPSPNDIAGDDHTSWSETLDNDITSSNEIGGIHHTSWIETPNNDNTSSNGTLDNGSSSRNEAVRDDSTSSNVTTTGHEHTISDETAGQSSLKCGDQDSFVETTEEDTQSTIPGVKYYTSTSFIHLSLTPNHGVGHEKHEYMSLNLTRKTQRPLVSSAGRTRRKISEDNPYEELDFTPAVSSSGPRRHVRSIEEEEIIKNGATFYRTKDEQHYSEQRKSDEFGNEQQETSRSVKEEVTPGQLRSPFFGDAPLQQNGVDDEVERDPNILRETRNKETIQFSELSNFKNKFETGVESQKVSTVSPDELDQVRQSAAAGSLRNKFESVAKGDQNSQKERKPMREITPPSEGTRVVYETEVTRNPDVVRADDVVDEGIYMPKPGASKEIWEKFQTGKIKDNAPRQRTSVIDEIQSVEGGVFENEPQINPDVVRSGEGDAFADLPSTGSTRDVLSKFKQMESGAGYVPTPKGVREITPPPSGKVEYVSEPTRRVEKYVGKAESGVFESQPDIRPDVVRSGQQLEEDNQLPQQGFTKSAAALFRQKEAEAGRVKTASTGGLRQITPPRDASVVYESQPERLPDVVRAEDRMDDDGLPHQGAARNMLAKFKQMESSGHQSSGAPRQMKAFTPPRDGGVFENNPEKFVPDYDRKAEGGVFENQPQHRDDVVRAADHFEEELPERGMARNMVARFRQLSESTKSQSPVSPKSPHDRSFKEFTPPREEPRSPKGVLPTDMPEQYQQSSGGVSENIPQHRADVVREADTDYEAGMPAPSTTKHLLARFQTIQHEAKAKEQPKPLRKEGGPARFRAVQAEKCAACQKTVYAMEKMEFNKNVYHKTCFKCSHCKNRLTPATFSVNQGILYCLNHFKQMFKTKGNYDEGFGREQYKKKWKSEPNIAGLAEEEHSSPRS